MKRILFSIIALMTALCGMAAAETDAFAEANRRFGAGDFAGAAAIYENILAEEGPRASVYYNLGNAYQQAKNHGPAILAYERARLLTPRDPDLLANLALARKAAAAFEETGRDPRLEAALGFLSRNEWSWLVAGATLFLGGLTAVSGAIGLRNRAYRKAAIVSAGAAVVVIIAGSVVLWMRKDESQRGVVLTERAALHLSPFEKAETLGTPGPGRIVRILERNGGFLYVSVPGTNLRGWLADNEVAAITTSAPGR